MITEVLWCCWDDLASESKSPDVNEHAWLVDTPEDHFNIYFQWKWNVKTTITTEIVTQTTMALSVKTFNTITNTNEKNLNPARAPSFMEQNGSDMTGPVKVPGFR